MSPTPIEQNLLREILTYLYQNNSFPKKAAFRATHENAWDTLDNLVHRGYLNSATAHYILTPKGLRGCGTTDAKEELKLCNLIIERLKEIYRQDAINGNPHRERTVAELLPFIAESFEAKIHYTQAHLAKTLMFLAMEWLNSRPTIALFDYERETQGTVTKVRLYEEILKVAPLSLVVQDEPVEKLVPVPQLTSINIKQFKAAFEPGTVKLLPFTVLIGKNGSGKSTMIEALQWVDATLRRNAVEACKRYSSSIHDLINLRSQTLRPRPFFALEFEWKLDKKRLRYEVRVEEDSDHITPNIATEELWTDEKKTKKKVLSGPESSDRLSLWRASDGLAENVREFWRYAVFLRLSPNRMGEWSLPRRTTTDPLLDEEGQNLPALLNELTDEQRADLIEAVKSVLPGMEKVTVSEPSAGRVHYSLHERMLDREQKESNTYPIPAWMLSEGTRRVTAIFALLHHHPPPSLLCIEEVENGLDPWAIKALLNHLQSAADRGIQILITTHSPWLLDHVPPETIIQAVRVQGDTRYEPFANRKAIKAYAASVPSGTRYVQED